MIKPGEASRRLFLRQLGALSTLGAASPLAWSLNSMGAFAADGAQDYKALVCIFMYGGNDAFNMVLPTDATSWAHYQAARQAQPAPLALLQDATPDASADMGSPAWLGGVLPLQQANAAVNPLLADVQRLFNTSKRLSVMANVGPLLEPVSKQAYEQGRARLPAKLFSHNDQQSTWMAFAPEGATLGWGGRLADQMASMQGQSLFTAVSTSNNTVWLAGQQTRPYQVSHLGGIQMGAQPDARGVERVYGSDKVAQALQRMVTGMAPSHVLEADMGQLATRSMEAAHLLSRALPPRHASPFGGEAAWRQASSRAYQGINPLVQQLQVVGRMMAARHTLGLKRQVFFVGLYGFDTHDRQRTRHAVLMSQLNHGLAYFDQLLGDLNLQDQVTTFTASDFGRSLCSNGDGSDHGWGAHHLVMGGAVAGGQLVGAMPDIGPRARNGHAFNDSPHLLSNGVMLPSTSVTQYGAALARWFGLPESQLPEVFPNWSNFAGLPGLTLFKA